MDISECRASEFHTLQGHYPKKDAIGVSTTALYNKRDRVETGGAAALVRDSVELAEPMLKALRARHPRCLPGYQIKVLDGPSCILD